MRLWAGLATYWIAAVAIAVTAGAARPTSTPGEARAAVGALAGVGLYMACARRLPRGRIAPSMLAVIAASATAEEVVWRGFVLAQAAERATTPAALVLSSLVFAFAHGRLRFNRVLAGAVFGIVYVAGGGLLGAVCAHATYNAFVAGAVTTR